MKDIRDKAEAMRLYAKQAGESLEMQNEIAEIKLRAERRAGEILKEMDKNKGGRPKTGDTVSPVPSTPTYAEVGIEKKQAERWQKEADVPEEQFEEWVASSASTCLDGADTR